MTDLYAVMVFVAIVTAMGFFAAWKIGCFDKK